MPAHCSGLQPPLPRPCVPESTREHRRAPPTPVALTAPLPHRPRRAPIPHLVCPQIDAHKVDLGAKGAGARPLVGVAGGHGAVAAGFRGTHSDERRRLLPKRGTLEEIAGALAGAAPLTSAHGKAVAAQRSTARRSVGKPPQSACGGRPRLISTAQQQRSFHTAQGRLDSTEHSKASC